MPVFQFNTVLKGGKYQSIGKGDTRSLSATPQSLKNPKSKEGDRAGSQKGSHPKFLGISVNLCFAFLEEKVVMGMKTDEKNRKRK